MNKQNTKVFFFANLPQPGVNVSYGGATILAENILKFLEQEPRLSITHQNIRKTWKPKLHLIDHLMWAIKFPFAIRKHDVVSFHGTWDFNFTVAPILWIWAKLLNKKIIFQIIGGNFISIYKKLPFFIRPIFDYTILRSDFVFLESYEHVNYFKSRNVNSVWVPNARKPIHDVKTSEIFEKKFVYLSRIIPEKGVDEIIEVSNRLPDDYKIDIIGPLNERYYQENQLRRGKANFINKLVDPNELKYILSQYDVLLLPSYFNGEGYPGIIIDSLVLGMPVITTYWKALPEMVQHKENGYLIEVKNVDQLEEAILHFNVENYPKYREKALKSFDNFNSEIVFQKIVNSYLNE